VRRGEKEKEAFACIGLARKGKKKRKERTCELASYRFSGKKPREKRAFLRSQREEKKPSSIRRREKKKRGGKKSRAAALGKRKLNKR